MLQLEIQRLRPIVKVKLRTGELAGLLVKVLQLRRVARGSIQDAGGQMANAIFFEEGLRLLMLSSQVSSQFSIDLCLYYLIHDLLFHLCLPILLLNLI